MTIPHFRVSDMWHIALVVFFVFAGFALRFDTPHYPAINGEIQRDYLVGAHIAEYGDAPSVGPVSGIFQPLRNSPFYFYVIALITALNNDFFFLQAFHAFLQVVCIVLVYFFGRTLFDKWVGALAAGLFALSPYAVYQADAAWHLSFVLPFIFASLFFFARYYAHRARISLIAGVVLFFMAGAVSTSVYPLALPLILGLGVLFLRRKESLGFVSATFFAAAGSALALNFSVLAYHSKNGYSALDVMSRVLVTDGALVFDRFISAIQLLPEALLRLFFFVPPFSDEATALAVAVFVAVSFALSQRHERGLVGILWGAAFMPAVFLALLNAPVFDTYFNCVLSILFVLVSHSILAGLRSLSIPVAPGAAFLCLALSWFVFSHGFLYGLRYDRPLILETVVPAIADAARDIRKKENLENFTFFDVRQYTRNSDMDPYIFMMPLEKILGERLFVVSDQDGGSLKTLSVSNETVRYTFLICSAFSLGNSFDVSRDCLKPFAEDFPFSVIERKIMVSGPFTLYLARKMTW